jgi:hypothetical protein
MWTYTKVADMTPEQVKVKEEYNQRKYLAEQTNPKRALSRIWQKTLRSANNRSSPKKHTISKEYLLEKLLECNGLCQKTGVPLTMTPNHPFCVSIDRIDSNKGYEPGNIQVVCQMFNYAKHDFDEIEFFDDMCKSRLKLLRKTK